MEVQVLSWAHVKRYGENHVFLFACVFNISGRRVINAIKEQVLNAKIIILSKRDIDVLQSSEELGTPFLSKPFDIYDLESSIDEMFQLAEMV